MTVEIDLPVQTVVTIPAEDWARFEAWARRPPRVIPELLELAAHRPSILSDKRPSELT